MKSPEKNNSTGTNLIKIDYKDLISLYFILFYKKLVYYAYKSTLNKSIAKDIVVEAFHQLGKRKKIVGSRHKALQYLYETVSKKCSKYLIDKKNRISYMEEQYYLFDEKSEEKIEEKTDNKKLVSKIFNLSKVELAPEMKRIFDMIFLEGLTTKEISVALNIAYPTIRVQKFRALSILRQILTKTGLKFLLLGLIDLF